MCAYGREEKREKEINEAFVVGAIIIDRSAEINTSFNIYLNIVVVVAAAVAAMIIIFLYQITPLGWFNVAKNSFICSFLI